ncbi:ABC transporter substrate-binding protein [Endozoicomonas sp. G2_1]|uniref:CmpA/NrtA family ABC transporter substrate-binding protein n=1 Tax=Endozoicomonas sp. G2_1 TaxID=2821091 RepID=UPI001AD9ED65|nr:CmpA/NrtA family ABC transporter substrate-binding protein [Endozoicomonas sp. G2_1]MBO9489376.1 ABC transporter substrate-binding protein [Endozoicomonas sp. G2_1]
MTSNTAKALEKTQLTLGIIALTDSAPLVIAKHLGLFQHWGLTVDLALQHSWSTLRDKLQAGLLDGAQMLAPIPLASCTGANSGNALITAFNLSMNGNGITLSKALYREVCQVSDEFEQQTPKLPLTASYLKLAIAKRKQQGLAKLTFAVVHPYSCHFYQLRDWLKSADIDIDSDIDVMVIAPVDMNAALESGDIDGFCVGNPWNAKAVRADIGVTVITSCDIWSQAPEKVLAVSERWQQQNPNTFLALLAAVQQACQWLAEPINRFEAAVILSSSEYLNEELSVVAPSLLDSCLTERGEPPRKVVAYNRFISQEANKPTLTQGYQLLEKMATAGQLNGELSQSQQHQIVKQVYRPDLYIAMQRLLAVS